jgi:hypothetical protein
LAATARTFADSVKRLAGTQALACSSVLELGVERPNAAPEHLSRRPSASTNTHELTGARRFVLVAAPELTATVATDEQLADATADVARAALSDELDDVELATLPHPPAATASRTMANRQPLAGCDLRLLSAMTWKTECRDTVHQTYSGPELTWMAAHSTSRSATHHRAMFGCPSAFATRVRTWERIATAAPLLG